MARRLQHLYLLPASVDPFVIAAIDAALVSNSLTQQQALDRLNMDLTPRRVRPISRSAWNRLLMRLRLERLPPERWRDRELADTVTVPRARYIELLELENAHLRAR